MTEPPALRDRIAALFRHPPGGDRLGDATPGEIAAAILAVLPAGSEDTTTTRAAVLQDLIAKAEDWDGHITVQELRRLAAETQPEVVHACPPDGSGLTPCCGRTPFDLPRTDRISSEAPITCQGPAS